MTSLNVSLGLNEDERAIAAALYWQAFGEKLGRLLGPKLRGVAFLAKTMDLNYALAARTANGALVGMVGFKTAEGGLIEVDWRDLRQHYGIWGAFWRAPLLSGLEREARQNALQMDGICVSDAARGQGVGTALLRAIKDFARDRSLDEVHLDVVDSNPRARALYVRQEFVPVGQQDLGLFRHIYGFRSSEHMVAQV